MINIGLIKEDREKIKERIINGQVDFALGTRYGICDEIILYSIRKEIIKGLSDTFPDNRGNNKEIPIDIILTGIVGAKIKGIYSLDKIPYVLQNCRLISELKYNFKEVESGISNKNRSGMLLSGDAIRKLITRGYEGNKGGKENGEEVIRWFNEEGARVITEKMDYTPSVHILDCTKVDVNPDNENYEEKGYLKIEKKNGEIEEYEGYKLSTLRGMLDQGGIIEEIRFGQIQVHDLELSRSIFDSKYLKPGDILIEDRGFVDDATVIKLKKERRVDVILPAKSNMDIYKQAVEIANEKNKWNPHPTRESQEICLVKDLEMFWTGEDDEVKINACVAREEKGPGYYKYYVFMTTNMGLSAKQIIMYYQDRPEIEEDYNQLKNDWGIKEFQSTKYVEIIFHIVMTLLGYNLYQIFKNTEKGIKFGQKTLKSAIVEDEKTSVLGSVAVYREDYFGIFDVIDFMDILVEVKEEHRPKIKQLIESLR